MFAGWETDFEKRNIDLDELVHGGPPKDGIPSIDNPSYISQEEAANWLGDREPVIVVDVNDVVRAFPIQILMWHEIVNDRFDGKPVAVTFCPLCYSTLVFDREVDGEVLEFGVSGFLRHSDLVMFDRSTESLWQQITGEALVGEYTGTTLEQLPSQLISFEQFRETHPEGKVLSRDTGHDRAYGRNPYVGYDDIDKSPMLMDEEDLDDRLRPMEKVVGVELDGHKKAYPYSFTKQTGAINDVIGSHPVVIFHTEGAASALDAPQINQSREDGSTGAFFRIIDERELHFKIEDGKIFDEETGSRWNIAGRAVEGPLEGESLETIKSGDYFAFAWLVFFPETEIFEN